MWNSTKCERSKNLFHFDKISSIEKGFRFFSDLSTMNYRIFHQTLSLFRSPFEITWNRHFTACSEISPLFSSFIFADTFSISFRDVRHPAVINSLIRKQEILFRHKYSRVGVRPMNCLLSPPFAREISLNHSLFSWLRRQRASWLNRWYLYRSTKANLCYFPLHLAAIQTLTRGSRYRCFEFTSYYFLQYGYVASTAQCER